MSEQRSRAAVTRRTASSAYTWLIGWANGSTGTVRAPSLIEALERAQQMCAAHVVRVELQEGRS